jgi:hypothetical protein
MEGHKYAIGGRICGASEIWEAGERRKSKLEASGVVKE